MQRTSWPAWRASTSSLRFWTLTSRTCASLTWSGTSTRRAACSTRASPRSADKLAPGQVYMILDEFILAGEIQETSKKARRCSARHNTVPMLTPSSLLCWTGHFGAHGGARALRACRERHAAGSHGGRHLTRTPRKDTFPMLVQLRPTRASRKGRFVRGVQRAQPCAIVREA